MTRPDPRPARALRPPVRWRSRSVGVALLALAALGCEDTLSADPFVSDADFLAALPHQEDHTLQVAGGGTAARSPAPPPDEDDGDWPDLYGLSVEVASGLNGLTLTCLTLVDAVVAYPPTHRAADARSWGPVDVDDDYTIALEMERLPESYAWDFRAAPTGTGPLPSLCAGVHDPGTTELARGTGSIDMWLENWDIEDSTVGTLATDYDLTDGQELRIDLMGVGSADERAEDGGYYFRQPRAGGGDFQYRTTLLVDDAVEAVLEVRTRWEPDGAGRSDARLLSDDYPRAYRFTECFAPGGRPVYRWTDLVRGAEEGDAAACPYASPAAVDQI